MAPPSLPQPLGRLPRDRLTGSPEYPSRHSPQSDMFALPATPASVGVARRKVRELLDTWGVDDDTTDNALLVASELVTNALTHTASERIVCRLRLSAGRLHIEVEDENRGGTLPAQRIPGPDEQCGRGLLLVGMLSSDWGVRDAPRGSGRIVWSELPMDQPESPEPTTPTAPTATSASAETPTPTGNPSGDGGTVAPTPKPVPIQTPAPAPTSGPTSTPVPASASAPTPTPTPASAPGPAPTPTPAPALAPVRPVALVLPPTPPAAHAAQVAAPGPWQPQAPHRTRPVPHSAEGTASHGPYGTTTPRPPYSRS